MATQPESHPTAAPDPDCLTYESFFGLREKPFSLSPDPRFFYRTASHEAAFRDLLAGIRRREGILALTGEVGTGKTTLCRTVLESLDRKTFAAFVPDPILSREDLLKTLLVDFGVVSVDEIRGGHLRSASRMELSYPLYEFLTSLQPLRAFAVVMIDEAQNLPVALLEEIRILSDLENRQKLLQLVLVGQPELQSRLSEPDTRQLTQRLSVRCELAPLSRPDVHSYTAHRLAVAGSTTTCFNDQAVDLVAAAAGGIPRIINLLCDRAMFRAAQSKRTTVDWEHVIDAADDLKIPRCRFEALLLERPDVQPVVHSEEAAPASSKPHAMRHGLPSTYQMRHDAHYVEELESIRQSVADSLAARPDTQAAESALAADDTNDRLGPRQQPDVFGDELAALRSRVLNKFVAAIFVLLLSVAGVWRWHSGPVSTNARQDGQTVEAAKPVRPLDPDPTPGAPTAQRYVIQMATFQGAARAAESVQDFQAAGYTAFSVEVSLRDGSSAHAVFLGPYPGRSNAEHALRLARQVPGYSSGWIVETDLAASNTGVDDQSIRKP